MQHVPAQVGDPLAAVETPALIVDVAMLEANLDAMARAARAAGIRLRPHAKAHKCPAIAAMQVAMP